MSPPRSSRGLSVIQGDADTDLADYPDASFDYAILSQTLQTTRRPDLVLDHLLRIGQRAFVSFPNFAHWRVRASLFWGGRMPVTRLLPVAWFDTPNIHHVTIDDFRALREGARHHRRGGVVPVGRQEDDIGGGEFLRRARRVPAAALIATSGSLVQIPNGAQPCHDVIGEDEQPLPLEGSQPRAGDGVDHAQGAERHIVVGNQRRARIESNSRIAGDERVAGEARVPVSRPARP